MHPADHTTKPPPRHFSMMRGFHLADFLTLGNAACGMAAVFLAMDYVASGSLSRFYWAAAMAPAAFVFDVLDGRVARWRQQHSALGRELDSLADVISFGVAPAALAYAAGLRGGWDVVALHLLRLLRREPARALQRHRGEPVGRRGQGAVLRGHADSDERGAGGVAGASGVAGTIGRCGCTAVTSWSDLWTLHPLVLLFVVSGSLMISKTLRIPKF